MSGRWRNVFTEWFVAYSLAVGIVAVGAKLVVIWRTFS